MTTLPQTASPRARSSCGFPNNQLAMPSPGGFALGQPATSSAMSGADVWRVIRANFWLILLMLVASAGIGYGLNTWLELKHSRYTAVGYIQVRSPAERMSVELAGSVGTDPAGLEIEQNTQVQLLKSESLLTTVLTEGTAESTAIRETEWFKQFVSYKDGAKDVNASQAKTDLLDRLDVAPVANSRLIAVKVNYSIPKDCQTIVRALVNQHIDNEKLKEASREH